MDGYMKYITSLPKDQDPPEAFGQHPNADIASQMEETKTLLGTILSLQPRIVTSGGKSREDTVLELCAQLAEQVPAELDAKMISRKNDLALDKSPLTTVLLQEVGRYNTLLNTVQRTLHDLGEGIKGILVISPDLEAMLECLYNNQVPAAWQEAYPSVKPLARWIT
jgi:dynein heavy chain